MTAEHDALQWVRTPDGRGYRALSQRVDDQAARLRYEVRPVAWGLFWSIARSDRELIGRQPRWFWHVDQARDYCADCERMAVAQQPAGQPPTPSSAMTGQHPTLHPATVEALRRGTFRTYGLISHHVDQALAEVVRVMRLQPPEKHARLLNTFNLLYAGAPEDDFDTRSLAVLASLKLGELLGQWHAEVHDQDTDHAGGDVPR